MFYQYARVVSYIIVIDVNNFIKFVVCYFRAHEVPPVQLVFASEQAEFYSNLANLFRSLESGDLTGPQLMDKVHQSNKLFGSGGDDAQRRAVISCQKYINKRLIEHVYKHMSLD